MPGACTPVCFYDILFVYAAMGRGWKRQLVARLPLRERVHAGNQREPRNAYCERRASEKQLKRTAP
jgi:hypothetical protein